MMNEFKNILVAIDTRREVHPVVTESVELRSKTGVSCISSMWPLNSLGPLN